MGKTFAEISLCILTLYLTQFFDFEFKDKDKYGAKDKFPQAYALMTKTIPIEVYLTKRK